MSKKPINEKNLNECITSIDFSQDYLAAGLIDEKVYVWQTKNEIFNEVDLNAPNFICDKNTLGVIDVKFNSQGKYMAVSSLDSCIRVYNTDEWSKVSEIMCNPMENWKLTFDQAGRNIITCGEMGVIKFYDIETSENTGIMKSADIFATCLAFSKNEKFLAIGNNQGNVFIYDMTDNKKFDKKPFKLDCHGKIVRSLAFTSDGLKLITASDDQHIIVIDLTKIQIALALTGHKSNINCVDAHPLNPNLFASCSYDKTIKLWDLDKKDHFDNISYHEDNIWAVKYSMNGKYIASGAENGKLAIHES